MISLFQREVAYVAEICRKNKEKYGLSGHESRAAAPVLALMWRLAQATACLDIYRALLSSVVLAGNFVQIENSRAAVRGDKVSFRLLRKGGV